MSGTAERLSLLERIDYQKIIARYEKIAEDARVQGNDYAVRNAEHIIAKYKQLLADDDAKADQ